MRIFLRIYNSSDFETDVTPLFLFYKISNPIVNGIKFSGLNQTKYLVPS